MFKGERFGIIGCAIVLASVSACSKDAADAGSGARNMEPPNVPPAAVLFSPADGTSDVGLTPLRVTTALAVSAETAQELAKQVTLRTYPELEAVDA